MPDEVWADVQKLAAQGIAELIPHAGCMSLLHAVRSAGAQQLMAVANSHRGAANPLSREGRLGAACGVEYAAQAMALHGALLAQAAEPSQSSAVGAAHKRVAGYLVSVRNLMLHVQRLDDVAADLLVQVRKSGDSGAFAVYDFVLSADDPEAHLLLSGTAYVLLQATIEREAA